MVSYISRATWGNTASQADLHALCSFAKKYNAQAQITGIITFHEGSFAQVLEGPEIAVRELLRRIITDSRHDSVKIIAEGPIAERCYADWSMEYLLPKDFVHKQIGGVLRQAKAARNRIHEVIN